jgi:hypothetical protein
MESKAFEIYQVLAICEAVFVAARTWLFAEPT